MKPQSSEKDDILDDIAEAIGFKATVRLVALHGGKSLYIPKKHSPAHRLARDLGSEFFNLLTKYFAGEVLELPTLKFFQVYVDVKKAAAWVKCGEGASQLSDRGLGSIQRCHYLIRKAKDLDLLSVEDIGKVVGAPGKARGTGENHPQKLASSSFSTKGSHKSKLKRRRSK